MQAGAKRFDWSNLRLRVLSGLVLAPAAAALVWVGGGPFLVLVSAAVALLAVEWGGMSAPAAAVRTATMSAVAILAPVYVAWLAGFEWGWALLPVGALATLGVVRWRGWAARPADVALGVLYVGAPALALLWLRTAPSGRDWTLMLLAITWSADIFAFLVGSALKGPKLWPRFSPNKTWSGFAGGLLASALVAVLITALAHGEQDPTTGWAAVVGLLGGLATMAGDLWESMMKRRFGVKDSGALIPGHGGLLDRVDGLMFAVLAVGGCRLVAHLTAGMGTG